MAIETALRERTSFSRSSGIDTMHAAVVKIALTP